MHFGLHSIIVVICTAANFGYDLGGKEKSDIFKSRELCCKSLTLFAGPKILVTI